MPPRPSDMASSLSDTEFLDTTGLGLSFLALHNQSASRSGARAQSLPRLQRWPRTRSWSSLSVRSSM